MMNKIIWTYYSLVILPLLLLSEIGYGQTVRNLMVGESGIFEIRPVVGISYCWSVSDKIDRNHLIESDAVTFVTTRYNPTISLKWERAGTFFLTVTAFNLNGCTNSRIFQVNVFETHSPVANDDYQTTTWLKSIHLKLLDNDYDAMNDLDTASFKVLSKPEFGEIIQGKEGSLHYHPMRSRAGSERILYRICDSCQQCDSAMVTITITDPPLFLPQGISPNGDGLNDLFVIRGLSAYPKSSLTIFSRDGLIHFFSEDYQNDWDGSGTIQNQYHQVLPSGTYYYLFRPGGSTRVIKGFVYLMK